MDDLVDPPRKKRGINKIEDLPPNESVDFNKHGLAVGKYQYLFGKYIGTRTRRNISILIKSWNKVPKEDKDLLWIDIKRHFRIENDDVKKPTLRSCGDKWRAFKNKLRNEYMLKNISPRNTWTYIEPRIWEEFCRNEHYTADKLKRRELARKRGKKQMLRPQLGSKGYRGFQAEWDKERKDPNKATELHLIPCLRGSDFCLSRVPRDQHGNKVVTSELLKLSRDMTVASEQLSQGTIESEAGVDAVVLVLCAEHGGRTRGVGGNVGYKKGIEGYVRKKKKRDDFEDIPDSLKQQQKKEKFKSSGLYLEMKEEIKADLRMEIKEEMREEMRSEVREEMRAEIREETRAEIREETRREMHSEFEARQNDPPSPALKLSSAGSSTNINSYCIKEAIVCSLYDPHSVMNGENIICATATVYQSKDAVIHGKKILKGHMKVSVLQVNEHYKNMKLPVPDEDIPILGDAVEGFIQWPVNAITRFTGRSKTPTLKEQAKGVPPKLRQGHITTSPEATIGPAIDQVILKGHGNTKELTKRTLAKPTKVTTVINKKLPKNSTTKTVKIVQPDHQQGPFTNRRSPTIVNDVNVAAANGKQISKQPIMKTPVELAELARIASIERVKKEKIAYRNKLTSLKSDIDANRSVAVKEGYNRWMSREDCAEPYTILVNKEIFRQSEDYMFSLNASDIIELLTYEDLETDILTLFAMSLYRLKGRSKNNKTGFVNPAMITAHAYIYDQFNTLDYLAQTLDGGSLGYEFYLAPYLQGHHWVLFIICPKHGRGFILDSLEGSKNNTAKNYKLAGLINSVVGDLKWELPNVNRQPGNTECGFYVMKWIHDFVLKYQNDNFPNIIPWGDERPLNEKEMEAVVAAWFTLWRD